MTLFLQIEISPLNLSVLLFILGSSLVLGGLLMLVFRITHMKEYFERSFPTTILILPVIISVIVLLISDNLARAFSLAGIFALVRFRMAMSDSKDITYILTTVAVGLATAMGYIGYALIICVFVCAVLLGIFIFKLEKPKKEVFRLKILIPENLNYHNVFDDIFKDYLSTHKLIRVKSSDFGTLFELTYIISFVNSEKQKDFIDQLRVRNSNLTINLYTDYTDKYINEVN